MVEQEKQAALEERQQQAARVSVWVDGGIPGTLHLMNRSPDPVTQVVIRIWHQDAAALPGEKAGTGVPGHVAFEMGVLPPCTVYAIPASIWGQQSYDDLQPGEEAWFDSDVKGVYFRDRNGERWFRSESGLRYIGRQSPHANVSNRVVLALSAKYAKVALDCNDDG